ncbi:MAG: phosphate signaling complex protein PhoU [Micromonosporaceae bacterium]|nr:phosphate signaling complex protein PhoU [Micromonosporaceae bacterium]
MREAFQAELAELGQLLVSMSVSVRGAMQEATQALLDANRPIADIVVAGDAKVDALHHRVEERAFEVIARQAPVAGDLRMVLTALRIGGELERMGDLAQHVAKIALMRHPQHAVPEELADVFREMGEVAYRMADKATTVLEQRDATQASELERDDDQMDALHRRLFEVVLDDWKHGVEAAIDAALLGRFYERYADHAVNAGKQILYLVTGETT